MDDSQALAAFSALSQETRLGLLKRLVQAGPDGMAAGALAEAAGVSASNLSFHLKELERAGLVTARRQSRQIFYSADYATLGDLVRFLMVDCCAVRPKIRVPVSDCCT